MKFITIWLSILLVAITACNNDTASHSHDANVQTTEISDGHNHEQDQSHDHPQDQNHSYVALEDQAQNGSDHKHEAFKINIVEYSAEYELFAEADPFIIGHSSNILAHFSTFPDMNPLENAKIELSMNLGTYTQSQVLEKSTRKGIYSFDLSPEFKGNGDLVFRITRDEIESEIKVKDIRVYASFDEAHHSEYKEQNDINTTVFTKEQSWKIDFITAPVENKPFGKVIQAVGQVMTPQCEELLLTSKVNGLLSFSIEHLMEGKKVSRNQRLFAVSSDQFVDNNLSIRLEQAKLDQKVAHKNMERSEQLFENQLITSTEILEARNAVDNANLKVKNLERNYISKGQFIVSPLDGYVRELFVQNGQYVEPGQSIVKISQNLKVMIMADIDLKNASSLNNIVGATIHNMQDGSFTEFDQISPSALTIGQHTNQMNYLVPVSLEIDNKANMVPGSFVEVFYKTIDNQHALVIPNSSLLEEQGKFFVYIQLTPELFEKRYVKTGDTDGLQTEILSGLDEQDRIVTEGAIFIKLAQKSGGLDAHAGHVH